MGSKQAIIDLGSNSVRIIIMEIFSDGSYKLVDEAKETIRLSEGMGEKNILTEASITRCLETLMVFKQIMDSHRVQEVHLVATAAVRKASNQNYFLDRIRKAVGLDFTVISGETEAYYAYLGVINTITIKDCLIIDIGGGSTELIWVQDRGLKEAISLPFGAITLTEALGKGEGLTTSKLKRIEKEIKRQIMSVAWISKVEGLPLIGIGGTIRTLAKISKKKSGISLPSLHSYHMRLTEVNKIYEKVMKSSSKERRRIPGIGKERSDIIAGGLIPIKILSEELKAKEMIISGSGLREGIFFHNYFKDTVKVVDNAIKHSINNLLLLYKVNLEHSRHVTKLALSIFDQTRELHGLDNGSRRLLETAAQLHDIGKYIDYNGHQQHGFYLVLNSDLNGLSNKELIMIAYIVAMHEDDSKDDWKTYKTLISREDYAIIISLSKVLIIAERLDRGEVGAIRDVLCNITNKTIEIQLIEEGNSILEKTASEEYTKELKRLFGKKLYVV